jgi:dephospho-CoA kinase
MTKEQALIIIGVTGTLGAGKSIVVEYLVKKKGFAHFSVRDFLLREIRKQGLPEDRDSMFDVANSLRAAHSPSYIVDRLFEMARAEERNCVIESIRSPGEIISLRRKGTFYLFAVDAQPVIRYQRILTRNSETDRVTFEGFLEDERREMTSSDPNHQNLRKCIDMADVVLMNDGTIEELHQKIETALKGLIK